jgi:hypothetical protein
VTTRQHSDNSAKRSQGIWAPSCACGWECHHWVRTREEARLLVRAHKGWAMRVLQLRVRRLRERGREVATG